MFGTDIRVFTTCPQSKDFPPDLYYDRVRQIAKWSDDVNCDGMLIYSDNSIVDAWLIAQIVIQETRQLAPLVAVQPIYTHPYTVAKLVVSLGLLHRRQVCLNMIAGGFKGDLLSLGDPTAHDERYARLIEYTQIIQQLLAGDTVTYGGKYYNVRGLSITPPLMAAPPQILMSGSSPAGREAARILGATAVEYPEPASQITSDPGLTERGIRVGIIAHADHDAAWQMAWDRFPANRRGQLQQAMAMKVSDSSWHQTLGALAQDVTNAASDDPYWLWPYKNYGTFCPYLVGDYPTVAKALANYLRLGYKTFILDIPRDAGDLTMAVEVFRQAEGLL